MEIMISHEARLGIAEYLQVPNEWIKCVQQVDRIIWFFVKSARYSAVLTKADKLKKNSIRID